MVEPTGGETFTTSNS